MSKIHLISFACVQQILLATLLGQGVGLDLRSTTSLYLEKGFDLFWEGGVDVYDEPQTSTDLKIWKKLTRDYPTAAPLHEGMEIPLGDSGQYFRVLRWPVGDSDPPSEVSNLVTSTSAEITTLSWTDSADGDVAHYEILPEGGDGAFYTVKPGVEQFTLPRGIQNASVRAVGSGGNRSEGQMASPFAANSPFAGSHLVLSPSATGLGRSGAKTFVAKIVPDPGIPMRYDWGTNSRLGTLDGEAIEPGKPVSITKVSSNGQSSVIFSVSEDQNPGGIAGVYVEISDPSEAGNLPPVLAEAEAFVEIPQPDPQIATWRLVTRSEPGKEPDSELKLFYGAWVFEEVPGYSAYVFTLLQPWPGQQRSIGQEDEQLALIYDRQRLIDEFGSNVLGLTDNQVAYLSTRGGVVVEGNADQKAEQEERFDEIVAQRQVQSGAVYSVMPRINRARTRRYR